MRLLTAQPTTFTVCVCVFRMSESSCLHLACGASAINGRVQSEILTVVCQQIHVGSSADRQDFMPGVGNQDCVLTLRRQAAVSCYNGPLVPPRPCVGAALSQNGLNCEGLADLHDSRLPIPCVMHEGRRVKPGANAVAHKVAHDVVALGICKCMYCLRQY